MIFSLLWSQIIDRGTDGIFNMIGRLLGFNPDEPEENLTDEMIANMIILNNFKYYIKNPLKIANSLSLRFCKLRPNDRLAIVNELPLLWARFPLATLIEEVIKINKSKDKKQSSKRLIKYTPFGKDLISIGAVKPYEKKSEKVMLIDKQ